MISHMYPSPVNPTGGIFVHEQVKALIARGHDVRVVSPKGWAPPGLGRWKAYRDVVPEDTVDDVIVHYPRKLTLPGRGWGTATPMPSSRESAAPSGASTASGPSTSSTPT